jgi:hypothetical protein
MISVLLCSLAIVIAGLLCVHQHRRRHIEEFARRATHGNLSQLDAVFALGRETFAGVKRGRNPVFLARLLAPLGPSPVAVLEKGGCCSGVNRLFITSLDAIGIRAAQITVYRPGPVAVHCLAQVKLDTGSIILDVDYGLWLRHPVNGTVDLAGLRSGVVPILEHFAVDQFAHYVDSTRTRPAGYPDNDYYRFDYSLTRTANWTMSPVRRCVYVVLRWLSNGRVDYLLLPPMLEWPELLLAGTLCAVFLAVWACTF